MANAHEGRDRVALLLKRALEGDASTIDQLRGVSQPALMAAADRLGGTLTFGRPTVLKVLIDWRDGRVTEAQVRSWAFLMFSGALPEAEQRRSPSDGMPQPIDVNYSDDEVVNDIVFELKDLGEIVDGIVTPSERNAMIRLLEGS